MTEKLRERKEIEEWFSDCRRSGAPDRYNIANQIDVYLVALEAERDSLDKTIHNLMVVNGDALAKVTRLESRLSRVDSLLMDNYPCYDKDGCKNCSGEADEIDYKSCVGYNTLTVLRVGVE